MARIENQSNTTRQHRVAQLLHKEIAHILLFSLNDPRFKSLIVTRVHVARDFGYARVLLTHQVRVNTPQQSEVSLKEVLSALNRAAKLVRWMLSQRIALRRMPSLEFFYDSTAQRACEVAELLATLNKDTVNIQQSD